MTTPVHALVPGDTIVSDGFHHTVASVTKNRSGAGLAIHTATGAAIIVANYSTLVTVAAALDAGL